MILYENLWTLAKASRPPGWIFGPILYTIGILHARAIPKTIPDCLLYVLQIATLSFPLCIIVFGVNDVYDYESDLRNPRKHSRSLEGGVLDSDKHGLVLTAATYCTLLVSLSAVIPTYGKPVSFLLRRVLLTLLILLLSWQYSAPPLRLKERPFLDSCSNGLIVWLVWALGYTSNGNSIWGRNSGIGARKGWLLALCTSSIHALGAAADIEVDGSLGQQTIATFSGVRGVAIFCVLNFFMASRLSDNGRSVIVNMYIFLCLLVSSILVILPTLAHQAFQTITYLSIFGSVFWIIERLIT